MRLATLVAAVLLSAGAPGAHAQRLDFDGAGVFQPSVETGLGAEIDALGREIAKLTPAASTPILQAKVRTREFALALLRFGADAGEEASSHVLLARRMLMRRDELDAQLDRIARSSGGDATLQRFLADCPTDPVLIPPGVTDLERLNASVFQPLLHMLRPGGVAPASVWPIERLDPSLVTPAAYAAALDALNPLPGVRPEALAGARGLSLAPADTQLVARAARALVEAPKWLSISGRTNLGAVMSDALAGLGSPASVVVARASLARAALVGDALGAIDRAPLNARQTRAMRTLGESLAREVAAGSSDCDDTISALRRALRLIEDSQRARFEDNRRVVREARPLWREAGQGVRHARDELIEAIGRLTPTTPALSDPGVLAALAAMDLALTDVRATCVISAWLAGVEDPVAHAEAALFEPAPEPGARRSEPLTRRDDRARKAVALRVLAISPGVGRERDSEGSLGAIRALAAGIEAWFPVPGEAGLRGADPDAAARWREITGSNGADLLIAIDAQREAWLDAWNKGTPPPGEREAADEWATPAGRLSMLREICQMGADLQAVNAMMQGGGDRGVGAWPGFVLGAGHTSAPDSITAPVRSELARLCAMVRTADYADLDRALVLLRGHAKILATLAALERGAVAQRVTRAGMLEELATPMPVLPTLGEDLTPGIWLAGARPHVANLCRALEAHAVATREGERDTWIALARYMIPECDRIQRALKRR